MSRPGPKSSRQTAQTTQRQDQPGPGEASALQRRTLRRGRRHGVSHHFVSTPSSFIPTRSSAPCCPSAWSRASAVASCFLVAEKIVLHGPVMDAEVLDFSQLDLVLFRQRRVCALERIPLRGRNHLTNRRRSEPQRTKATASMPSRFDSFRNPGGQTFLSVQSRLSPLGRGKGTGTICAQTPGTDRRLVGPFRKGCLSPFRRAVLLRSINADPAQDVVHDRAVHLVGTAFHSPHVPQQVVHHHAAEEQDDGANDQEGDLRAAVRRFVHRG